MRSLTILLKRLGLAAVALVALGQATLAQESSKEKASAAAGTKTDRQIEAQDLSLIHI